MDVRSIFSDFAIRVEREELSDVVWRMSSAILARTISELYQRKIEFTDVLRQNVPKFELYKHNDELFSMYDRIFYEL